VQLLVELGARVRVKDARDRQLSIGLRNWAMSTFANGCCGMVVHRRMSICNVMDFSRLCIKLRRRNMQRSVMCCKTTVETHDGLLDLIDLELTAQMVPGVYDVQCERSVVKRQ
jgi:hypothetical protein